MTDAPPTFTSGTLQAWIRLPMSVRLFLAVGAVIAICFLAAAAINAPSNAPAVAKAAVGSAPMRDPSVPDAGQALTADGLPQEPWIPTF